MVGGGNGAEVGGMGEGCRACGTPSASEVCHTHAVSCEVYGAAHGGGTLSPSRTTGAEWWEGHRVSRGH